MVALAKRQLNIWNEAPPIVQGGDIFQLGKHRLMCGDSTNPREVDQLMQGVKADACITDPPYPREFSYLYEGVALHLPDTLKDGGCFLSIVPHYLLPEVLEKVNRYLKYRWTLSMWQGNGSHPRMAMGIEVMWKPIVWWVNGSWPQGRGFVKDGFDNVPVSKKHHEWEQSISWAEYCLKFVPSSSLIFEPFLGGGTLLIACEQLGYQCYSLEKDPLTCETAIQRWQEMTGQKAVKCA